MNDLPKSTLETIFTDALALPAGERQAFVERACAGDSASAAHVKELLRGYEENSGFLEASPAGREGAVAGAASPEAARGMDAGSGPGGAGYSEHLREPVPGERIGQYKLLERIGEGACGIVYMAEQEQPVRRRVALKLIKLGLDTRDFIARFEAERQALALMDHANIARVFDAGATDKGRPYFVMELVRGVPITRYCDENQLAPPARLELFITVCHAIQHAHQKGIIHRDIKPSNILVAVNDGEAVPKVIDFGIAKATQGRLTDKTVFTRFHAFIGTPAYSSPEQAEVTNLDVDTRSDIYSLGVLLYELLTGHQPLDHATMERLGFEEMRRLIREVEPPRPSARCAPPGPASSPASPCAAMSIPRNSRCCCAATSTGSSCAASRRTAAGVTKPPAPSRWTSAGTSTMSRSRRGPRARCIGCASSSAGTVPRRWGSRASRPPWWQA